MLELQSRYSCSQRRLSSLRITVPPKEIPDPLTISKLICPVIDTVDADLMIKQRGNIQMVLRMGQNRMGQDLLLTAGIDIRDTGERLLMSHDDAGHITGLGRMDGKIVTGPATHVFKATAVDLAPFNQSGTLDEEDGSWLTSADDILFLYLGRALAVQDQKANARIEELKIWYNTAAMDDFITEVRILSRYQTNNARGVEWENMDDQGNGLTGNDVATYTPNWPLGANKCFQLEITTTVGTTSVKVYSIELTFSRG